MIKSYSENQLKILKKQLQTVKRKKKKQANTAPIVDWHKF